MSKKSIEKIISQNMRIEGMLDILIQGQKTLESRIEKLEVNLGKYINDDKKNNNSIDPKYVNKVRWDNKYT